MSKNKENVPKLRFPGFTEAWQQRRLSDGTSKIGDGLHGTPKYTDDGNVYFINGNNLVNGQIVITDETKCVTEIEQSKDDKALDDNTLLMSINGTIGNLAWYNGEKLMLGKSAAYITVSDFDKRFIYAYLQTPNIYSYFMNNLTGSTIKNLGLKTIRETKLLVPSKEEQVKIGHLFYNLDHLITLHQRNLNNVKNLKAGLLQKMFPKDGEAFPEVRFPGFTDAWEQRELGEISDFITKGATPTTYGFKWEESGIPFFRNDSIKDNRFVFGEYSYISEEACAALIRSEIRCNDILIAITGDIGKVGIVPKCIEKANINQHMAKVRILKDAHPYFVYQYLSIDEMQKKYQKIKTGLSMPQLSLEQIRETIVKLPSREEQKKIGAFFKKLDHLITLHQRKLGHLQEQKKALLQQMFV
ncbi:restriction endonuclease subunit S [Paenibacillus sp. SN-8-1]|uniref:restriction endonuclease subunit S n=1 Tax=Paenibacillus sp. SN-8-1 TaxID=3435409 RepID=UPI003D9A8F76